MTIKEDIEAFAAACRAARAQGNSIPVWSGASIENVDLSGADLAGANLSGANLYKTNLEHVDLRGADLRGADLFYAVLSFANLRHADLTNANMSCAFLDQANLAGAIMTNASMNETCGVPYRPGLKLDEMSLCERAKALGAAECFCDCSNCRYDNCY